MIAGRLFDDRKAWFSQKKRKKERISMFRQQIVWMKRGAGALRSEWATVLEEGSAAQAEEVGLCAKRTCQLLIRELADVEPGDGVWMQLEDGEPPWRVTGVKRYALTTCVTLEAA